MDTNRKIARNVALLFLATMFVGMIDAYTVAPILNTPLDNIGLNGDKMLLGAFCILLMSVGVVFIAILLYPILEKQSPIIANTYLSFRILECLLLFVGVIVYLLLIHLSQEFIEKGSPDASYFQTLSMLAIEMRYAAYHIAMFVLGVASIMLCYLFYQTRLIPRFISVVGLIGYALLVLSAPLDILGIIDTTGAGGVLYVPGAIFEIILLPGWLIAKGFNTPVVISHTS